MCGDILTAHGTRQDHVSKTSLGLDNPQEIKIKSNGDPEWVVGFLDGEGWFSKHNGE